MITLHHLQFSRSFRILWALEELGLDYQIKYYKRTSNYAAPDELKKIHPLGKAPILTDGDLTIAESALILDYLQEKYDVNRQFKPQNFEHLIQYNYWMHYAEGSLMPLLVMKLVLNQASGKFPPVIQPVANEVVNGVKSGYIAPRVSDHIEFLESHLSDRDFFAGDFSFADIQMSFPIIALQERVQEQYLKIKVYSDKIQQRPAFIRAKEKSASL